MRFARWVFLLAGLYGLATVTPHYFLESRIGREYPPAVTHPAFYYGFVGVAAGGCMCHPSGIRTPAGRPAAVSCPAPAGGPGSPAPAGGRSPGQCPAEVGQVVRQGRPQGHALDLVQPADQHLPRPAVRL